MTKTTETPATPRKPDGTFTRQINNQTLIIEVFFKQNGADTFQDKLLRVILSEKKLE